MIASAHRTARGSVECGEEPVASRINLPSTKQPKFLADALVMLCDKRLPFCITQLDGSFGRVNDVREQHSG
jgi:hypothetical protein